MARLGAHVPLATEDAPAYGAVLHRIYDGTGREVRTEARGRELEVLEIVPFVELDAGDRVTTATGKNRLIVRRDGSAAELREEVRRIAYDDTDRNPRWLDLMRDLERKGVKADDAALAALPFVLEIDDEVVASTPV